MVLIYNVYVVIIGMFQISYSTTEASDPFWHSKVHLKHCFGLYLAYVILLWYKWHCEKFIIIREYTVVYLHTAYRTYFKIWPSGWRFTQSIYHWGCIVYHYLGHLWVYYWVMQLHITLYSLKELQYNIYVVIIAIFCISVCENWRFGSIWIVEALVETLFGTLQGLYHTLKG